MDTQDSQERKLLIALENIKRLTTRPQLFASIPRAEFLTMFVINASMQKAEQEKQSCPGVMISKLSELLQISRPTASQMISSMEEKGYTRRVMSTSDRRVIYICLTEKGQAVLQMNLARYSGVLNEIIEKVGRKEIDQLIFLCDRFQEVVNEVKPRLLDNLQSVEEHPVEEPV
ncbi:MarR family winged helix-turn-helix transcriptional regulator [Paenibacillus graminis]|uniref:MarR family winged helix-turn-helix transcriptional regulator n=1 Tax=Paenibacillus graminis TaxID=189425 RepID=UPI002DBD2A02|nr:MarR family transcriptional regulator [Paenibacillus graminis]MEC0170080.1 MarR family transcriptional regulator [Paenibacillus graminis]